MVLLMAMQGLGKPGVNFGNMTFATPVDTRFYFPGYAEDSNWNYSWNVGIGSTTFDATSPGFAHLNLAGPWSAPPAEYQNAEIIRYSVPAYHDFEVRLRNSNNNGWDAPGAPDVPDPTYGLGSEAMLYEMEDGSGLLLSAALWETGGGARWNGDGVAPDEVIRGRGADYAARLADQLERALTFLSRQTPAEEPEREAA